MPERYLENPLEMAKAVKYCTGAVKWLTTFTVAGILWIVVLTGLFYQERIWQQNTFTEQRHQDCVAALDERDQSRQRDLEQWQTIGIGPHGEPSASAVTEFINGQYENLPPPPACQ